MEKYKEQSTNIRTHKIRKEKKNHEEHRKFSSLFATVAQGKSRKEERKNTKSTVKLLKHQQRGIMKKAEET